MRVDITKCKIQSEILNMCMDNFHKLISAFSYTNFSNDDSSETGTKITPLKPDIRITRKNISLVCFDQSLRYGAVTTCKKTKAIHS